jgi:cytochrome c
MHIAPEWGGANMQGTTVSAALLLGAVLVTPALAGDPEAGRQIYIGQCFSCHNIECTRGHHGPALGDVFGQPAGNDPGWRYTDALVESGIVWDEATLDEWLADPAALVPGTSMRDGPGVRASVPDADNRRNVIAFILSRDTSLDLC